MTKGLKVKGAVFKNKKGLKEKNNEYLWTSTVWLLPFSVEMRASQSLIEKYVNSLSLFLRTGKLVRIFSANERICYFSVESKLHV